MSELLGLDVVARHRCRGVVKAYVTKLFEHVIELERKFKPAHSDRLAAQRLQQRLIGMDGEFKCYHLCIVDLLEDAEELETKQVGLDNHDDRVTDLFNCPTHLTTPGG